MVSLENRELEVETTSPSLRKNAVMISTAKEGFQALPVELKMEIFRFTIPIPPQDPQHLVRYHVPYRLSHAVMAVCQAWRQIALATPELWVYLPPLDLHAESWRAHSHREFSHINTFLERSAGQPIHIAVLHKVRLGLGREGGPHDGDSSQESWTDSLPRLNHALTRLLNEAHRWQSATLHLHKTVVQILPRTHLPMLRTLNLRVFSTFSSELSNLHINFIGNTPCLRDVVLDRFVHTFSTTSIFTGITRFTGFPKHLPHLRAAEASLKICILRGPISFLILPEPSEALSFPQLDVLRVESHCGPGMPPFATDRGTVFGSIYAPNLRELIVEGEPTARVGDTVETNAVINDIIISTFGGGCTSLTRLHLNIFTITRGLLKSILEAAPALVGLSLQLPNESSDDVFQLLELPFDEAFNAQVGLVPSLKSLCIMVRDPTFLKPTLTEALEKVKHSRSARANRASDDQLLQVDLEFPFARKRLEAESLLETRGEGEHTKDPEYGKLLGWTSYLAKEFLGGLPGGERKYGRNAWGLGKASVKRERFPVSNMSKLDTFFDIVEKYQVRDPKLTVVYRIMHIMSDIASQSDLVIPEDSKYHFRSRATSIVESWNTQFGNQIGLRKWSPSKDGLKLCLNQLPEN